MAIDIEDFENGAIEDGMTTREKILRFLKSNDHKAFTRSEIADAIDVNPNTVGTNLSRLKDRELVRHRGNYWAIIDDDARLAHVFKTYFEDEWLDEELGTEQKTEWVENAADPDEFEESDGEERNR